MDPEVQVMSDIATAIEPLDHAARERVLQWAMDKYNVRSTRTKTFVDPDGEEDGSDIHGEDRHDTIAELFAAIDTPNGYTRALVVGYWLQVKQGKPDFTSLEVNKELKNLGHGSKRINNDFDDLKKQKPQLAVQLKKSGKSQQARKRYKITQAGIDKVKALLGQDAE